MWRFLLCRCAADVWSGRVVNISVLMIIKKHIKNKKQKISGIRLLYRTTLFRDWTWLTYIEHFNSEYKIYSTYCIVDHIWSECQYVIFRIHDMINTWKIHLGVSMLFILCTNDDFKYATMMCFSALIALILCSLKCTCSLKDTSILKCLSWQSIIFVDLKRQKKKQRASCCCRIKQ